MKGNVYFKLGVVVIVVALAAVMFMVGRSVGAQEGESIGGALEGSASHGEETTDTMLAPVVGGPGFYMQNSIAFRPYVSTTNWAYIGGDLYNPEAVERYFYASLSLPNSATITKMVVYFVDNCSKDLSGRLYRLGGSGEVEQVAALSSSGTLSGYRYAETTIISHPVVDQQSYSYVAEALLPGECGSSLRLVNVRVDFAFTASLPLVAK